MLDLIFITSSKEKLAHAKYLSKDYPVRVLKKKNYGIGYLEPRIDDRNELIKRSVEDALLRFKKHTTNAEDKLFFIEDTSVIVHSLSEKKEYPGVDVKYWMRENSFKVIDRKLKDKGNNRGATVRSDLILVLNKSLKEKYKVPFIVFTSSQDGRIVDKEVSIKTQPLYPWLNNSTFNKWFVPQGEVIPISKLPIEVANQYDFRASAFREMFQFLKNNGYLKNELELKQLELFEPVAFIISGPSCAGKTTLSTYLQNNYNYYHLEASDFMYLSYYERHGTGSTVQIGDFAESALKDNPSIVVDQILNHIKGFKHIPLVITGFRSPVEVEQFKKRYSGGLDLKVIYIDADQQVRYDRNLLRNRGDVVKTLTKFKGKDTQQYNMGLSVILNSYSRNILQNNGSLDELYQLFELKYQNELQGGFSNYNKVLPKHIRRRSLENVIIQTLYDHTLKAYTTTEIAHLIRKTSYKLPKNKNNISRYFNQNYYPFYDISINEDGKISYQLSQTGRSYAKWTRQQFLEDVAVSIL